MTHFIYILWFLALLVLAGEVDRRWGGWFCDRFLPELPASQTWYWPPVFSLVVPGAGQLLNHQPAKGLLCFLWPFVIVALHRSGQTEAVALWWLIHAWYASVLTDALLTSLTRSRYRRPHLRRHWHADSTTHD
ncbi:MAG: hypothetical protein K0R39_1998 [Symbiobacteriaceae bacterium]|jgi:hypothetical protein|nr:hypothetical protein [Symbiobacteriaceae bacterium]